MAIDERDLDDVHRLEALDSRGVLRALAGAGAQVRRADLAATEAGVASLSGQRPRGVLVSALGGAAILTDLIDLLTASASPVPVTATHGPPLPGWVGPLDLVLAASLSGRAAGPLAVAAEAARRGASLVTVGAPDSPLAEVTARARGIHIPIRPEGLSSRSALWSLLIPVVRALTAAEVIAVPADVLDRLADRLDEQAGLLRPAAESFVNPAKSIALELSEGLPVVLGQGRVGGVAAHRAAGMLTRTARTPAMAGELPDEAAAVVACFGGPYVGDAAAGAGPGAPSARTDIFHDPYLDEAARPGLRLLLLRDAPGEPHEPMVDAMLESAALAGVRVVESAAGPGHRLERVADLISTVDFAAVYLALGSGIDPGLSPQVADLRRSAG